MSPASTRTSSAPCAEPENPGLALLPAYRLGTPAAPWVNATTGQFFESTDVTINDDKIDIRDGNSVKEGDATCGADHKPGIVQVAIWLDASTASTTDPDIVTENIDDISFKNDRAAYTIAF